MTRFLGVMVVFAVLGIANSVRASEAGYPADGRRVQPTGQTAIRMARETVILSESAGEPRRLQWHCRYWFTNPGDSASVKMEFPIEDVATLPDSFVVSMDGSSIAYVPTMPDSEIALLQGDEGLTRVQARFQWTVSIPARGERVVDVDFATGVETLDGPGARYFVEKATPWAGPAPQSEIYIHFSRPMPLIALTHDPTDALFENHMLHWRFNEEKPARDVSVHWNESLRARYAGRMDERFLETEVGYRWNHQAYSGVDDGLWENLDASGAKTLDASLRRDVESMRLRAKNVRHEIYARRGQIFKDRALAEYFGHQSWYSPDPTFSEARLSEIERLNVAYCRAIEALPDERISTAALLKKLREISARFW